MSTSRLNCILAVALLVLPVSATAAQLPSGGALSGRVTTASDPLSAAAVYAYQLADMTLSKVVTDTDGRFSFDALPAGLYKVIASKPGFLPAVVLLTRATSQARQFVSVELATLPAEVAANADDFWSVRGQIPSDVLRDLDGAMLAAPLQREKGDGPARIVSEMAAISGTEESLELGASQVSGGDLGVRGAVRDFEFGINGSFRELQAAPSQAGGTAASAGRTQMVSLDLSPGPRSRVHVTSMNNHLTRQAEGAPQSMDLQVHQVNWTQPIGRSVRSDFSARYLQESNFFIQGPIELLGLPQATRSWRLEGSFETEPSERTTLRTGFRYRERQSDYGFGPTGTTTLPQERMEIFSDGGIEVKPAVLVEYGLYSAMRDGSLSLAPRGGVVVRLGPNWNASTFVSRVVQKQGESFNSDFIPAFINDYESCEFDQEYCYQVMFSRAPANSDSRMTIGAIHRKFSDTLRLYFDDDFFNHVESLFLVQGDRLPELQFSFTKRLGDSVLTKLESNVASGGGGILYGADSSSYENAVRYLVTSLDTQFENTSTGVFLAFHHLQQELTSNEDVDALGPQVKMERLQLMLTQDLNFLSQIASEWAVHLNMELSRGTVPDSEVDEDEFRKRLTGGVAVRF